MLKPDGKYKHILSKLNAFKNFFGNSDILNLQGGPFIPRLRGRLRPAECVRHRSSKVVFLVVQDVQELHGVLRARFGLGFGVGEQGG